MGWPAEVAPSIGRPISKAVRIISGAIGFTVVSGTSKQTGQNFALACALERGGVSAWRRIGVSAFRRATEDSRTGQRGQEGLKGFRIYEELDFARFGPPRVYPLRHYSTFASRPSCGSVIRHTPIRRERRERRKRRYADTPTRLHKRIDEQTPSLLERPALCGQPGSSFVFF